MYSRVLHLILRHDVNELVNKLCMNVCMYVGIYSTGPEECYGGQVCVCCHFVRFFLLGRDCFAVFFRLAFPFPTYMVVVYVCQRE